MLVSNASLRLLVARTFTHSEMKNASRSFAGGTLPRRFDSVTGGTGVPNPLRTVAMTFVALQEARHEADYNLQKRFTRGEARRLVDRTAQAFRDWQSIRKDDYARLYLACLLLWERWEKLR
jgi:hypothetical protein